MKTYIIGWTAALAVLCAALVYFNLPAHETPAGADAAAPVPSDALWTTNAPYGNAPGEQLPDFTLTTLSGESFTLSEQRGNVVILNLWATWCAPCVKELPHFDALLKAHPDARVLAIHSDLITDDVSAYLNAFSYSMAFAVDEGGEAISLLGGTTMLPQTVVVDRYGVVVYNKVGSVTYEALEQLYSEAASHAPLTYAESAPDSKT